ncbi:MAG: flagellar biosynthetic protein FliO [Planctomycetes bacterium]|nr:flagellar biosynthetic protein FliO [Planctomycetota bacterium]
MPIPILASAVLQIAAGAPEGAARAVTAGTQGPDMTRYVLVCAGLLLAIVGVAALIRRMLGSALSKRAAARNLQVMDVLPLGGKQRLAVVRCYDRTFLLGLGEKELTSISELDAVIAPQREAAPSRADLKAFSSVLERLAPSATKAPTLRKEGILG